MEAIRFWLSTPPSTGDVLDPFGIVFLTVFAAGFMASAYLAGPGAEYMAQNPVQLEGVRHWANVGLWVFGPGLFFFVIRASQINPLSFGEPIWLVGSTIALVVAAFRCVDWWRTIYPERLAASSHHQELNSSQEERPARIRARRS